MKKSWKILIGIVALLLLLVIGYVVYVLTAYHRIGDMTLAAENNAKPAEFAEVQKDTAYSAMSYNIGFGAYEEDFGFFMDGGTESWAWSEERLTENLMEIGELLRTTDADFYLLQEVDRDSTRSYHVDELNLLSMYLGGSCHHMGTELRFALPLLSLHPAPRQVRVGYHHRLSVSYPRLSAH